MQIILRSLDGLSNEETSLYLIQGQHTTPNSLRKVSVLGFAMKTEGLSVVFKNSLFKVLSVVHLENLNSLLIKFHNRY